MIIKLFLYLLLTVSGLFLMKKGGASTNIHLSSSILQFRFSWISILGIFCYVLSFLLWINIIKENDLSYIYPFANGLVTIFTVVGGILIFNEKIEMSQILGIALIIIGVILVNIKK